jgi:DNA-binding response OmpR family regulator/signal transduction histidine kinase
MANSRDRILIVEADPVVSDLIGRQALQASGYQVFVASDATTAISKALQWAPDLIITNINLPGLSGKDLMVALSSQGVTTPVIILAQRGVEADIIQTFRLGASDYLLLPVREAEVITAVSRVLQQVHDRRERDRLAQQLQQTNHELQARVRELTTIFAVGKAVTSITDQGSLLEKVLDGAIRVTQADLGWFLLREDTDRPFMVVAERNLPPSLGVRLNHPWDDGISSLVAMSGEPLSIHGEPLKRFKIFSLGLSALIVPIKVQKKVIGLLVMMRKQPTPFNSSEQHLLDALADYASISLVNVRLFRAVEDRVRMLQRMAESAQVGEKVNSEILQVVKQELSVPTGSAMAALDKLSRDPTARWRPDQRQQLTTVQDSLQVVRQVTETISPQPIPHSRQEKPQASLADTVRNSVRRMQGFAQQCGLSVVAEMPSDPIQVAFDGSLLSQMIDGLLSHAIRYSSPGALVSIQLARTPDGARAMLKNSGGSIAPRDLLRMIDEPDQPVPAPAQFGGLGIRLHVVKEIITSQGGKLWLEGQSAKDVGIHIQLPLSSSPKAG